MLGGPQAMGSFTLFRLINVLGEVDNVSAEETRFTVEVAHFR